MRDAGVAMEIWSFAVTRPAYDIACQTMPRLNQYGVRIRLFRGFKPAWPLSELVNAALLRWWLWRMHFRPAFIHARTEYSTAVAAWLKPLMSFRLIWDARGDALSEFRLTSRSWPAWKRLFAPLKLHAIRRRLARAAKYADRSIFVSEALRRLQGDKLPKERTLVVPCVADDTLFHFSPELRAEMRRRLGYSENHRVLIYVGSTAIWQCVPQTVELMQTCLRSEVNCRVLIITSERDAFRRLFDSDVMDRVFITSDILQNINGYLNAADFGFLLREQSPINYVASPVKHAEYCLAGLSVVATDSIAQVESIGKKLKNRVDPTWLERQIESSEILCSDREDLSEKARGLLARRIFQNQLRSMYVG